MEQSFLDLYFRVDQQVELGVKGKGTIHLSGYIEPDEEGLNDLDLDDEEESEEEE